MFHTETDRRGALNVIQYEIDKLEKKKNDVIVRLASLSDQGIIEVVRDEFLEIESQLEVLYVRKVQIETAELSMYAYSNVENENEKKSVEEKEEPKFTIDDHLRFITESQDKFIMEPDLCKALEHTNKINLRELLQKYRVKIPKTLDDSQQTWLHFCNALKVNVVVYTMDEHDIFCLGPQGSVDFTKLKLYVYTMYNCISLENLDRSYLTVCIKKE